MVDQVKEYARGAVAPTPAPAPAPPGPSPEEVAAQKEAEIAALKAEMAQKEAAFAARFDGLERLVGEGFRNRATPAAPVPPDTTAAYAAQQDLGLTDEEILANPAKSFEKIRDHLRNQIRAEMTQEYGAAFNNLTVTAFQSQVEALRADPYFEDLSGALIQYFQDNPQEASIAGQVRRIYNELIGVNIGELQKRAEARKQLAEPAPPVAPAARPRAVEPSLRAPVTPTPMPPEARNAPIIDEAEANMMEAFNKVRPGLFKDEAEWAEVAQGKRFPKKIATDIQAGRAKPNVSYESSR